MTDADLDAIEQRSRQNVLTIFAADARRDIPALVAEVRRLRAPSDKPFDVWRYGCWALDVLDAAGFNDSPAADAIRDQMDKPWQRMTPAEYEAYRQACVLAGQQWASEPPTVPGWYWVRHPGYEPGLIHVLDVNAGDNKDLLLIAGNFEDDPDWHTTKTGQWSGPLTPPPPAPEGRPEFLARVGKARQSIREGKGVRLEDVPDGPSAPPPPSSGSGSAASG